MRLRLLGSLALAMFAFAPFTAGLAQNAPPTPPPPVAPGPAGAATSTPGISIPVTAAPAPAPTLTATATPSGRNRRSSPAPAASGSPGPAPSGSDVPVAPQFSTMDGVWEVASQTRSKTIYTHLTLVQSGQGGTDIRGSWDRDNKRLPLTGTFDGRIFTFTVVDSGKAYTLAGYIENFSDAVGMITEATGQTPFTMSHRKRERGLNIAPGPGGGKF